MLLIDDLITSPIRGIFWIFKEIHKAAQQEQAGDKEAITAQLSELYMRLETREITEAEFEAQEKELLDRLDRIAESQSIKEVATKPGRTVKKTRGTKRTSRSAGSKTRRKVTRVATVSHP